MQGHRNLKYSLEEVADFSLFANPEVFERFMALEPLAGIELADSQE
jgi:hypothetical protein